MALSKSLMPIMTMKFPVYSVIMLCVHIEYVIGHFDCIGTCYSGRRFPEPQDIFYGKHLKGFSYKNITTGDPRKCYSSCTQDCRCKACQMKDARCELLDEDKTSKAGNFVAESGYVYYDLKQTMYQGKSHMLPPNVCHNGCCQSEPCMNGGTCTEHCESTKKKFTCHCPKEFHGKVCEKRCLYSCMDVLRTSQSVPKNGVYVIERSDIENSHFPVFCDFEGPNRTWTLIESFSLKNNPQFQFKPFTLIYRVNVNKPANWPSFRMGQQKMKYTRSKSTLFRATCDYPNRNGSLNPDLLIGSLSDIDIINGNGFVGCKKFKLVNIGGYECTDCTAGAAHGTVAGYHFHLDVSSMSCDFKSPIDKAGEDRFGFYDTNGIGFKCTATPQSTTQWWLGEEKWNDNDVNQHLNQHIGS